MRKKVIKITTYIARYLVGLLFIFSGLIKLNDPVGTQIKLEEYFEVFAADLPSMHDFFLSLIPLSLYFSVFLSTAEIVLGVALLVRYSPKTTMWLLLIITVFFGLLTFYSAYYNKVTDCGCFGDAIKLKPWTSFTKDAMLFALILYILWNVRLLKPLPSGILVLFALIFSLGLGFYSIRHLPPIDLLPYRVGNSISNEMKPSEPYQYLYIFEKGGKTYEFDKYPEDTTYVYKEMLTPNEDEAKPKITDYRVWNDQGDFTEQSLQGDKLFIIIKNLKDLNSAALPSIKSLVDNLQKSKVEVWVLTSVSGPQIVAFLKDERITLPYYFVDGTVLKTISRSDPGLWLLKDGIVEGKWHYNDTPVATEVLKLLGK